MIYSIVGITLFFCLIFVLGDIFLVRFFFSYTAFVLILYLFRFF